ncbi:DoxX family protein [Micromonospora sp. NPDC002717]|uniref:DoxX family protein n=1 Tax=Micromonospora sp. NPDC002717 TaxID=3154424 RepID=UPI00332B833E
MTLPTTVRDVAMLLARIGVGIVFFAHGWQKLVTNGVDGTAAFFDKAGVPLPTVSAWFATGVELLGGAALILGAVVPIAGVLLALDMLGAFIFVHAGNGLFVDKGGYELVLVLGAASLLLAAVGAGRLSVDHLLTGRRAAEPAPAGRA